MLEDTNSLDSAQLWGLQKGFNLLLITHLWLFVSFLKKGKQETFDIDSKDQKKCLMCPNGQY